MDWSLVFDEGYPQPGATDDVIARFVAEVGRPMASDEIREVNAGQTNPFPKDDPLHTTWRPFDPADWIIPDRPPPRAYLSLLRWSDGGEFRTGERWFQFFPALDPRHGVRAMLLAYHLPQFMPRALPLAFNGGGTFALLDMREPSVGGEYPIVCSHAGNLGWAPEECVRVADSFLDFCRDTIDVDELRNTA